MTYTSSGSSLTPQLQAWLSLYPILSTYQLYTALPASPASVVIQSNDHDRVAIILLYRHCSFYLDSSWYLCLWGKFLFGLLNPLQMHSHLWPLPCVFHLYDPVSVNSFCNVFSRLGFQDPWVLSSIWSQDLRYCLIYNKELIESWQMCESLNPRASCEDIYHAIHALPLPKSFLFQDKLVDWDIMMSKPGRCTDWWS